MASISAVDPHAPCGFEVRHELADFAGHVITMPVRCGGREHLPLCSGWLLCFDFAKFHEHSHIVEDGHEERALAGGRGFGGWGRIAAAGAVLGAAIVPAAWQTAE